MCAYVLQCLDKFPFQYPTAASPLSIGQSSLNTSPIGVLRAKVHVVSRSLKAFPRSLWKHILQETRRMRMRQTVSLASNFGNPRSDNGGEAEKALSTAGNSRRPRQLVHRLIAHQVINKLLEMTIGGEAHGKPRLAMNSVNIIIT
ncbi:hypothetical protein FKM82_018672 [Ascaphus truei]